ncbi:hypothetical protein SAY87_026778 [Trapa incisa]|uniref:Uncharacterized protein n=1 Tax=Trapa incisa TaxID=236973 RepID=A0AAN7GV03_9MYRT|nr:hypothetical protein SAY87_026778 [Trapa incisa]
MPGRILQVVLIQVVLQGLPIIIHFLCCILCKNTIRTLFTQCHGMTNITMEYVTPVLNSRIEEVLAELKSNDITERLLARGKFHGPKLSDLMTQVLESLMRQTS